MTAPKNTKAMTAKVRAELTKVCISRAKVKSPMVKPSKAAAATPTAADSVGVAMPKNKLPNTATMSTKIGQTASVTRSVWLQGSGASAGTKPGWRRALISM